MSKREEALAEALQLVLDDWANSNVILEDAMDRAHAALAMQSATLPPNDEGVATILMGAWSEYVALFGHQPHGTFKQIHSMLALQSAGRRIAALFTQSATPRIEKAIGIAHYLKGYGKGIEDQKVVECALDIIEALRSSDSGVKP